MRRRSSRGRGAAVFALLRGAGSHKAPTFMDPGSAAHRKSAAQHPGNARGKSAARNFDDTAQEAAFRAEAKAWISANAPKQYEDELKKSSLGRTQLKGANILEVAKAWQKKKADAGWACLHWPKEYGGRGSSPIERVIWQQEEGAFGKLSGMFIIGHGMCGPAMMAVAGEEEEPKNLTS